MIRKFKIFEGVFKKKREPSHNFSIHTHVNFYPKEHNVYYFQVDSKGGTIGIDRKYLGKTCEVVKIGNVVINIKFNDIRDYGCTKDHLLPLNFKDIIKKQKEVSLLHKDLDPYGEEDWPIDDEDIIKEKFDLSDIDPYGEENWGDEKLAIYKYHNALRKSGIGSITDIMEFGDIIYFKFSMPGKKLKNGKKIHTFLASQDTFLASQENNNVVILSYSTDVGAAIRCELILPETEENIPEYVYIKVIIKAIEELLKDVK